MSNSKSNQKNIKPGDICMILGSLGFNQHDGKIVTAVKFVSSKARDGTMQSSWECEPVLFDGEFELIWANSSLIPLLGGDGDDETLAWCAARDDMHLSHQE